MNLYVPFRKGSLLIPTGPCQHLHIICNDPVFYPAKATLCFLAVNISSIDPLLTHDASCILKPGDHPFITHDSFVYYKKADIFGATTTARRIAEGDITIHDPFDDAVFERILTGFSLSKEALPKIKKFVQTYCQ
ncbi:MAG: hypothetical protein ACKN9T_16335 [Candidatus Methylumidiphilus sp.]